MKTLWLRLRCWLNCVCYKHSVEKDMGDIRGLPSVCPFCVEEKRLVEEKRIADLIEQSRRPSSWLRHKQLDDEAKRRKQQQWDTRLRKDQS